VRHRARWLGSSSISIGQVPPVPARPSTTSTAGSCQLHAQLQRAQAPGLQERRQPPRSVGAHVLPPLADPVLGDVQRENVSDRVFQIAALQRAAQRIAVHQRQQRGAVAGGKAQQLHAAQQLPAQAETNVLAACSASAARSSSSRLTSRPPSCRLSPCRRPG
jgi:hypothetical protein